MGLYNSSNNKLVKQVEEWFRDSRKRTRRWRTQAREDFKFYAGDQWSDEDKEELEEKNRPIVTFNRVAPTIDSVTGSERANRQETRFLPRTTSEEENDGPLAEMWTESARWVRDECDAEDEESHAYEEALICGLGWTDTWVDYEAEPDGQIKISRRPTLAMYYDPDAIKRNLSDAKRVQYAQIMSKDDIKEMWPDAKLSGLADSVFSIDTAIEDPHLADEADEYRHDQGGRRKSKNDLVVVQTQWWERESVIRAVHPETGDTEFLTKEEFEVANDTLVSRGLPPAQGINQTRKVYYQCFVVGKTLLEKSELHPGDNDEIIPGFTLKAITGKRDEAENVWFGIMRAMKDPQRWSNKFFSQIQDIINSNAKGGLIAEKDAFENPRKAQEDWSSPDKIVFLTPGALSGKKVSERTSAAVPPSLDRLMQIAIGAVRDVSGVNIEMLGQASRTQSGVVEQSRIQQGLITLAVFFDSLRRYRKDQGRILLHMMMQYLPEGTLIRVVGQDRYIKFSKDPEISKFDLIVDQSPTSPNFKQEVWGAMQQMIPALAKAGTPIPWEALLKYTPLPYSVIAEIQKFIKAQQPSPEQQQMQQRAQEAQVAQLEAEVTETLSSAEEKKAKAFAQVVARYIDAEKAKIDADKVAVDGAKVIFEAFDRTGEDKEQVSNDA